MSSAKLEEKYGYLFHQLADHNACLSEAALFQLLTNICRIMEMLGESVAYGNHLIRSTVANCFKEVIRKEVDFFLFKLKTKITLK